MEIIEVRIQNYKSIIDTGWVEIEDEITTLIGKNESGKSSFLEAISSLSHEEEYSSDELHIGPSTPRKEVFPIASLKIATDDGIGEDSGSFIVKKYSDGRRFAIPTEKEEEWNPQEAIENIQESAEDVWQKLNQIRNENSGEFRTHFDNNLNDVLNRIRNSETDDLEFLRDQIEVVSTNLDKAPKQNDEVSEAINTAENTLSNCENKIQGIEIADVEIEEVLPTIVYHEEFDVISDSVHVNNIDNEDNRTFRNLLKLGDINHEDFQQSNQFEQQRVRDSAEVKIANQINSLWEQKSISLDIDFTGNEFAVQIKDESLQQSNNNDKKKNTEVNRALVPPSSRSKGFQWFFSFYVNLAAATKAKGENTNQRVVLLDDPAVFLHPEGKKNWMSAIEGMTDKSQIIYTSHSPFLIRKEYPERIRVVEDKEEKGTQISRKFWTSDTMTLKPLRNALGIGLGDSLFVSKQKLLVEGVSDYYYLTAVTNYLREYDGSDILDSKNVTIYPTNGGNQMVQAAKWVASEEFSYALLLDNDDKGKEVQREIENQHQEIDSNRVFLLWKEDERQNYYIEIEDLFDPEFFIDCVNSAYRNQFEDFEEIDVERKEESWKFNDVEYKGRKITSKVSQAFDSQKIDKVDKVLVANEICSRLKGGNADPEDIRHFKPILGKLRNVM